MSRSSGRGQVEPFAALVALAAVGIGLSLYAGVASDALARENRPPAEQVLEAVTDRVAPDGVARPERLAAAVAQSGPRVNATLQTRDARWAAGPPPPSTGVAARRLVSIDCGPTRVRPGRLRVVVW